MAIYLMINLSTAWGSRNPEALNEDKVERDNNATKAFTLYLSVGKCNYWECLERAFQTSADHCTCSSLEKHLKKCDNIWLWKMRSKINWYRQRESIYQTATIPMYRLEGSRKEWYDTWLAKRKKERMWSCTYIVSTYLIQTMQAEFKTVPF